MNDDLKKVTHRVSTTESAGAVYGLYATVTKKGGIPIALSFTETYSKAKNPTEHRTRASIMFERNGDAIALAEFLKEQLC